MSKMQPVLIHEDGTECDHAAPPARTMADERGPACSAGIAITHVRFSGKDVPIADAVVSLQQIGAQIAKAFNAEITALAAAVGALADSPQFRILAQAAAAVTAEREREAGS